MILLRFHIDKQSSTPLYQQLADEIVNYIKRKELQPGDALPSVRKLCAMSGVSHVTAVKAYEYLQQRKVVRQKQGRGTFVAPAPERAKVDVLVEQPDDTARNDDQYAWQRALQMSISASNFRRQMAAPDSEDMISFTVSYPDESLWPVDSTRNQLKKIDPFEIGGMTPVMGLLPLRETMVEMLGHRGIHCSPHDDVMITNGTQQGMELTIRTLVRPGDWVACEAPTYAVLLDLVKSAGGRVMPVPVDSNGMDVSVLEEMMEETKVRLIYTIPTFQNPTGAVMAEDRRRRLLEVAAKHNAIILEDDPFPDLYFDEPPPRPIKSWDESGRVVYLAGLTKFLFPGLRLGALVASGSLADRLTDAKLLSDMFTSPVTQTIACGLLQQSQHVQTVERNRSILGRRLETLCDELSRQVPDVFFTRPSGGLNVWITLPEGMTDRQFFDRCIEERVLVVPGHVFFHDVQETRHIRLSFAGTSEDMIRIGVERMARAFHALAARPSRSVTRSDLPVV